MQTTAMTVGERSGAAHVVRPRRRSDAPAVPVTDDSSLAELARRAGYRLETASLAGHWLLIDTDGELARTPRGERAWTAAEARRRLDAVGPRV